MNKKIILIIGLLGLLALSGCNNNKITGSTSNLNDLVFESCRTGCVFGTSNVRTDYIWNNTKDDEYRQYCVEFCGRYVEFLNEYEEQ